MINDVDHLYLSGPAVLLAGCGPACLRPRHRGLKVSGGGGWCLEHHGSKTQKKRRGGRPTQDLGVSGRVLTESWCPGEGPMIVNSHVSTTVVSFPTSSVSSTVR